MNTLFVFKYFWIAFIVVGVINAVIMKRRAKPLIQQRPELAAGYSRLFKGFLFWGNLPWVVMGAGIVFGGVPNIFSYFRPQDGNSFVLLFHIVIGVTWILALYWIFLGRGAEFLAEHPMSPHHTSSPSKIRLMSCVMVIGGVVGEVLMWTMNFPVR